MLDVHVFDIPQENRSSKLHHPSNPLLMSLFSNLPLYPVRDKNKIWPVLDFFVFSSSLVWQQHWRESGNWRGMEKGCLDVVLGSALELLL